jgi:hypothetical protein
MRRKFEKAINTNKEEKPADKKFAAVGEGRNSELNKRLGDAGMQMRNEGNILNTVLATGENKGGPYELYKKRGAQIAAVLVMLTAFSAIGCSHADTRYIMNQFERDVLGDTLKNINRKAEQESRDMLNVERDEARKIREDRNRSVHEKKEAIHKAYQRRVRVN